MMSTWTTCEDAENGAEGYVKNKAVIANSLFFNGILQHIDMPS